MKHIKTFLYIVYAVIIVAIAGVSVYTVCKRVNSDAKQFASYIESVDNEVIKQSESSSRVEETESSIVEEESVLEVESVAHYASVLESYEDLNKYFGEYIIQECGIGFGDAVGSLNAVWEVVTPLLTEPLTKKLYVDVDTIVYGNYMLEFTLLADVDRIRVKVQNDAYLSEYRVSARRLNDDEFIPVKTRIEYERESVYASCFKDESREQMLDRVFGKNGWDTLTYDGDVLIVLDKELQRYEVYYNELLEVTVIKKLSIS